MSISPVEIGSRIKEARKAANMSQSELANKLDKTLRTLQKYESGDIEPSIAMVNLIADTLKVSPAYLMGYQKDNMELNSLPDVLTFLYNLDKKNEFAFDIEVKRPPHYDEWTCSIKFNGNNSNAKHNADICLFLERYAFKRLRLQTYFEDQEQFDHWFEKELAYYADCELTDKKVEVLSHTERTKRRNELDRQMLLQKRKEKEQSE